MESRYQHTVNGQSVLEADLNVMGEASALADDRVFAELFRLAPYDGVTVSRGLLPSTSAPLVGPNAATGSVAVSAFRAVIGSRTAVATDPKKNHRDIRSTIGVGTTTLGQLVVLAANASGNPRWDLIYAAVAVDANGASVTRKVKDPTSKVITAQSLVTTLQTTVAVGVVAGTPGVAPAFPVRPADAGGTYYIALAYVRVPNGFGAVSTVSPHDINEVAPVLGLSRVIGASGLRPADQQNVPGGTAISSTGTSTQNGVLAWGAAANVRPGAYLPPTMVGSESLIVAIDAGNASNANWSHQNGAIVDGSRNWLNRLWRWDACVGAGGQPAGQFPWAGNPGVSAILLSLYSISGPFAFLPGSTNSGLYQSFASGMGTSIPTGGADHPLAMVAAAGAAGASAAVAGANIPTLVMASGTQIYLYVDTGTGALKVGIVGIPLAAAIFWLDASAPYENI